MEKILTRLLVFDFLSESAGIFALEHFAVHSIPILNIIGEPGTSKTMTCQVAAALLGRDFLRISCSSCTTYEDLFGMALPDTSSKNSDKSIFVFREGLVATCLHGFSFCVCALGDPFVCVLSTYPSVC